MPTIQIKSGDTLSKIAASQGTSVAEIMAANKDNPAVKSAGLIIAGGTLNLPEKIGTPAAGPIDETEMRTLPPTGGGLSNFRTVLRSALNEATQIRTQSALKQLAPLSEGTPGGMGFLADAIKAMGIRPRVETMFSDIMEQNKEEIARLREEGKAPEVIGSAETGYMQWNKDTRSWMPISSLGAAGAGEAAISDDTWVKLIGSKQVDVGDKGLKGKQRDRVLNLLSDNIPRPTDLAWVKRKYQSGELFDLSLPLSEQKKKMISNGVPETIINQVLPSEPPRVSRTPLEIEASAESVGEYFPEALLETFLAPGKAVSKGIEKGAAGTAGFIKGLAK